MKKEMTPDIVKREAAEVIRKAVFAICDDMHEQHVVPLKEENLNLKKQITIYEGKRKRHYPLDRILSMRKRKIKSILNSK
jgi:hypothetical protein